jgi:hypothetical protein
MNAKLPRRVLVGVLAIVGLLIVNPLLAAPPDTAQGAPNFMPALYGDGELWGTKGTTALPAPKGRNLQSFDKLFVITNSNNPGVQLPVSEAAPGNPDYNGGRWFTHTVMWTAEGFMDHGIVPILMSYDDIQMHASLGHLDITPGSPGGPGAPPDYFQCPMLPVLDQ